VVKVPGFSLVRPKNKTEIDKNIVETSEPENKKEEFTTANEDKDNESTANLEQTHKSTKEKELKAEIENEQNEPQTSIPTTELETSTVDEIKIIRSRPKERINCEKCERNFGTPLFIYDYSEGKRNLVGCCPYCSQIIGKPPNKKLNETENGINPETEKLARLQEKAKKRETMAFQINSSDLDELIKNTAYVR
jgi:hypothetical protein